MKYITFKNLKQFKTEKANYRARAILYIATENGRKKKASEARYKLAKKLYNLMIELNKYKEWELWAEEEETRYTRLKATGRYDRKEKEQDRLYNDAKALAKKLNIKVYSGTWYHLSTLDNNQIYTNAF